MRPFVLTTFFSGSPTEGGGFTQKRRMLDVLRRLQSHDLRVVVICTHEEGAKLVKGLGMDAVISRPWKVVRAISRVLGLPFCRRVLGGWLHRIPFTLDAQLKRLSTDLVFFP